MSDNAVLVSVKDPSNPMGPMFVLGGKNADDFVANGTLVLGADGFALLMANMRAAFAGGTLHVAPQAPTPATAVQNIQAAFPQATVMSGPAEYDQWAGTNAAPNQGWGAPPPAQPAPQPRPAAGPPPGVQAPICECGYPRQYKSGNKKNGKGTYQMWACPQPQGPNQHEPIWL